MAFSVRGIHVIQKSTLPPETPGTNYLGPFQTSTLLPVGHTKDPSSRPLPCPILFEHNYPLVLRDGTIIHADIFRPPSPASGIPILLAWGPFGKSSTSLFSLDLVPGRSGIPRSALSGYQNWEAPDPAEWVPRGYAIVNIDPRGVFDSQGDIRWLGRAEGQDGYDAIEQLAKLRWSNGKVGMVGNSWLAMAQWFIAAEKPPSLKCIAPWEGCSDVYRESLCRGGVPYTPFWGFLGGHLCGLNKEEDVIAMLEEYPYMNAYWDDKRANIGEIDVPAYIVASYSTAIHTVGSFRGFEEIKHEKKWLRVHTTQEWHDLYQKDVNDDLELFVERYLKNIENGWEETPHEAAHIQLPFPHLANTLHYPPKTLLSFDQPALPLSIPWCPNNTLLSSRRSRPADGHRYRRAPLRTYVPFCNLPCRLFQSCALHVLPRP